MFFLGTPRISAKPPAQKPLQSLILEVLTGKRHWNIIKLQRLCRTIITGYNLGLRGCWWVGKPGGKLGWFRFDRLLVVLCPWWIRGCCLNGETTSGKSSDVLEVSQKYEVAFCQMLMFLWKVAIRFNIMKLLAPFSRRCWKLQHVFIEAITC